jgi:type II secretory pathway pseudopilin PulG
MKLMHGSVGLIIFGLLLIVVSAVWPHLVQFKGGLWTEQQASEHAKIAADLHRLGHGLTNTDDSSHQASREDNAYNNSANYQQVKARYQQSDGQLHNAQFWSQDVAEWIKWFGIACCLSGTILFYFLRSRR